MRSLTIHRLLIAALLASVLLTGCDDDSACANTPGHPDAAFNAQFGQRADGWSGGDGSLSVALPDGRVLWLFGDSFIGAINADGSRAENTRMIRNAGMIQTGTTFATLHGEPAWITPDDPDLWYWPGDGTVQGDQVIVFMSTFRQGQPGMWGFESTGRDDAVILALPTLEVQAIIPVDADPRVRQGINVLEDGAYVYIYGVEYDDGAKYSHVARAPAGDVLGTWEYYTGAGWSPDPAQSTRILRDVSDEYGVIKHGDTYYLITQESTFGTKIYAYTAPAPEGPWESPVLLYCTPETGDNVFTYNAQPHPEFTADDELLISYDVNSQVFEEVLVDASIYRPRFIRVPLN